MINVDVKKFFIVSGSKVQLELIVDGMDNIGYKKIENVGKDTVEAILGALGNVFGYNGTGQIINPEKSGQSRVFIEYDSKKCEGLAQFQNYLEIPDSIVYAYFRALEQIVGEIKIQLPPLSTPYNWE